MDNKETRLVVFDYQKTPVRSVIKRNGEPVFVLKDICDILGIKNSRDVFNRLDDDEKGVDSIDTPGGKQVMQVVNESGMYDTILRSDSPLAKPLRRYVTHEILPTLRKTGTFHARQLVREQLELASCEKAIADANARMVKHKAKLMDELRRAIKRGDQVLIQGAIEACRSAGIDVPDYDFGDGWDMGSDQELGIAREPAITRHDDGTVSLRMHAMLELNGQVKPLEHWCKRIGLTPRVLRYRMSVGMSIEDALTVPPRKRKSSARRITTGQK